MAHGCGGFAGDANQVRYSARDDKRHAEHVRGKLFYATCVNFARANEPAHAWGVSKSNTWETALLNLVFTNTDATGIGDAGGLRGSASAGSLYVSLHTADPGEGGTQATSEVAYTSYARVAVARSGAQWAVASGQISNVNAITFPTGTGGSGTATHFAIGVASSGATTILYSGALASSIVCGNGVQPAIPAGALIGTED